MSVASKSFAGLNLAAGIRNSAKALGDAAKVGGTAQKAFNSIQKVAVGLSGVFAGLVVIDLVTWFWNIATAAQQAAQKIRDDFNAAIAEIDDNTAATQALITQYITLREKTSLTAAEQSILAELAERLAEKFPELGDQVRDPAIDVAVPIWSGICPCWQATIAATQPIGAAA